MRRGIVTAAAIFVLGMTALGAVHATAHAREACIPPAVIQALS
jgi:hypothetical protein